MEAPSGAIVALPLPLTFVVVPLLLGEAVLGVVLLARAGRQRSMRLLGSYLIVGSLCLGLFWLQTNPTHFGFSPEAVAIEIPVAILASFLPSLLFLFALSYPTPVTWLRQHPRGLLWFVVPPLFTLLSFVVDAQFLVVDTSTTSRNGTAAQHFSVDFGLFLAFALFLVGSVLTTVTFWQRSRLAKTTLEQRRLRDLARGVGVPLILIGTIALGLGGTIVVLIVLGMLGEMAIRPQLLNELTDAFAWAVVLPAILVPAIACAWVVVRYKFVDADLRLRFTLRQSVVGGFFLMIFFSASELAETFVTLQTDSRLVGLGAALLLLIFLRPLEKAADRVARRAVPNSHDTEGYRGRRRLEVYRAALEELVADDGRLSEKERRALDRLATQLGMTPETTQRIEDEVRREHAQRGATPAPTFSAVA